MRYRTSLLAGLGLVALGTTTLAPTASAATHAQLDRVVGYDYVDGNTVGVNTVVVLARHADGSLTPTASSPVAVGGAGTGAGLASQGAIQASPNGRYLLAVDAGSNEISVLRVQGHGRLTAVGRPVSSGGVKPVSIAIRPDGVTYVANVGTGGSNYTGFRLASNGQLTPIPGSTVAVPESSGQGDVLFNTTGDRLVGTRDNPSLIDSFSVSHAGYLTAAPGSPFTAETLGPIGAEFRPTNPSQLFVTNAHAGAGNGTVSAFQVAENGTLTAIAGSPFRTNETASCWIEITHDGRFLFSVNTASATISRFEIKADGSLELLGSTPFANGQGAIDARLTPDGAFLSVVGGSSHLISTFAVDGGDLHELAASPVVLPAAGAPVGLVSL
jgi:6-phosphogluconolactonase (cycloisomerase 2 family)